MAPAPKRRKVEPVAELTFDPEAREEYLTGFHKRKLQRQKHAQEIAQKRDKEEKVNQRRELREQRKREAEQRVEEVSVFMKKQAELENEGMSESKGQSEESEDGEGEEWAGFEEPPAVDATDEYVDEDKFTTVTVKELDDIRDYETEEEGDDEVQEAEKEKGKGREGPATDDKGKRIWTKKKPFSDKPKKKKKTFRYESKLERQTERKKQKLKSSAAAKARKEK